MERKAMTVRRRRMRGEGALRAWLLSGASAAVLLAASPAYAQVAADERVYRQEALAHAGAVEAAWRRLETYILDQSAGPAAWTGARPPAAAGWRAEWTVRGLEARYCGDTLLVYLAPEAAEGRRCLTTARCTRRPTPTATPGTRSCTGSRAAWPGAAPGARR